MGSVPGLEHDDYDHQRGGEAGGEGGGIAGGWTAAWHQVWSEGVHSTAEACQDASSPPEGSETPPPRPDVPGVVHLDGYRDSAEA